VFKVWLVFPAPLLAGGGSLGWTRF